jgi:zinc protease
MLAIKMRASYALFTCVTGLFLINSAWAGIPIQHWTQPSGVQVFLAQSPAIPMVDVLLDFDAGARRDPAGKAGLAHLTAGSTAYGVRATASEPALDENGLSEAWADLGASFGGQVSADRMSYAFRSLTYPDLLDRAGALAGRQLGEPSFPEALWLRDRPKLLASLKEAETRPATLANRAFAQAVYGPHPYGGEPTAASLADISVEDMRTWQQQWVRPCNARVSVVGALDRAQADTLVKQLFARIPAGRCAEQAPVPEVQALDHRQDLRIAFVSAQAHVLVGQPGFKRDDPDFFALIVGNHILGGSGFTARLTEEVRVKRGLSYSVYSHFSPGRHAGAFMVGLQTRPDQAQEALELVRTVLERFVSDGPTPAELQAAKDNLIGGFPLLIDSNRKLVGNLANIAWNGLPLDYLDTWTQRVQKLTAADIQAAFQRKLQPNRMVSVVLGGS